MINKLNDDCQLRIIQYLSLKDQITLSKIDASLKTNVHSEWQHRTKHVLSRATLDDFESMPATELHDFLDSISLSVRELFICFPTLKQLRHWQNHCFPNLKKLTCHFDDDENGEQDVPLLFKLFPTLSSLTLGGNTTGNDIQRWTELVELDLSNCWALDVQNIEQICHNMKLQKFRFQSGYEKKFAAPLLSITTCSILEELEIDSEYLTDVFLTALMQLPKFRKLRFQTKGNSDNTILSIIAGLRAKDVHELLFHDSIWTYDIEFLLKFRKLKQLTMHEEDINAEDLKKILCGMACLEQLHITNTQVWRSADQLWDLVASSPNLRLLNISGMKLYGDFFNFKKHCMINMLDKRRTFLTLQCYDTVEDKLVIHENFHHPKLKVEFSALKHEYSEPGSVQINFHPLN